MQPILTILLRSFTLSPLMAIVVFLLCTGSVTAQKAERQNVRDGNNQYKKENFTEAEIAYRKSIEVNPRSTEGIYNLGNALYKQEKYPEALEQYQLIAGQGERLLREDQDNIERLAHLFHNMGNIGMKSEQYEQSIEAYKQSLRLNPSDDETRYNLALAQKLLQDQQQEDQDQDQNQEQEQEQEQEQQQDQNQDQQEQQQNPEQQQQEEEKTQEEDRQNEQMSRDNAQQILDAFLQDERETQEKVRQQQMLQQQNRRRERQW